MIFFIYYYLLQVLDCPMVLHLQHRKVVTSCRMDVTTCLVSVFIMHEPTSFFSSKIIDHLILIKLCGQWKLQCFAITIINYTIRNRLFYCLMKVVHCPLVLHLQHLPRGYVLRSGKSPTRVPNRREMTFWLGSILGYGCALLLV